MAEMDIIEVESTLQNINKALDEAIAGYYNSHPEYEGWENWTVDDVVSVVNENGGPLFLMKLKITDPEHPEFNYYNFMLNVMIGANSRSTYVTEYDANYPIFLLDLTPTDLTKSSILADPTSFTGYFGMMSLMFQGRGRGLPVLYAMGPLPETTITDFSVFFKGTTNLVSVDLSNIKNVESMESCFEGCTNLTTINGWNIDTENVNMANCFKGCESLTTITREKEKVEGYHLWMCSGNDLKVYDMDGEEILSKKISRFTENESNSETEIENVTAGSISGDMLLPGEYILSEVIEDGGDTTTTTTQTGTITKTVDTHKVNVMTSTASRTVGPKYTTTTTITTYTLNEDGSGYTSTSSTESSSYYGANSNEGYDRHTYAYDYFVTEKNLYYSKDDKLDFELSGHTSNLIFSSSIFSSDLLNTLFKYKYRFGINGKYLNPTKKNFVLWADESGEAISNSFLTTKFSDTLLENFIDRIYPVGSIYLNANSNSPETLFPNTK